MAAKQRREYGLNIPAGKMLMTFLRVALLHGTDIWKAFANFVKPAKVRHLAPADTGNDPGCIPFPINTLEIPRIRVQ